jgi:integrase
MPDTQPARKQTKRIHFTARTLENIPIPTEGRTTVYYLKTDLALRVDANGTKSFFWFKSARGTPIFRSLGTFPSTLIEQARVESRKLQNDLEAWRTRKYAEPNPFESPNEEHTFEELLKAYVDKRVAGHAAHPERAKKETLWIVDKYLPAWKNKTLSSISDRAVRARHREIAKHNGKTIADRVIQLTRRLYQWGIKKEKMYSGPNPALGVEYFGSTQRERFLSGEEIARLFKALRKESNHDLRDFVNLSLWTGARRGDVLSMAWKDVLPLENNTWTIPEPKGGRSHSYRLPLVTEAIEILQSRKRSAVDDAVWVFPSGAGTAGHLVEVKRSWAQLLKRAKIEDFHIHDLRRSLASWQAGLGTSLVIIGKTLGHRPGSSATQVYARVDLEPVRASIAQAVAAMQAASKVKPKSEVPARHLLPIGKQGVAAR